MSKKVPSYRSPQLNRRVRSSTPPDRSIGQSLLNGSGSHPVSSSSPLHNGLAPRLVERADIAADSRWEKRDQAFESIDITNRDDGDMPFLKPHIFDCRPFELVAAVAPYFGKYMYRTKSRAFQLWKKSTFKIKKSYISRVGSPWKNSIDKSHNPFQESSPFRRVKISAKYSERWKVPTSNLEPEETGLLAHRWDLRHPLKKEEEIISTIPNLRTHATRATNAVNMHTPTKITIETRAGDSPEVVYNPNDWSGVDMNTFGLMPDVVYPIFHANEGTLWKLYAEYILCDESTGLAPPLRSLVMSTSRDLKTERAETRLMPFETLWTILRDFEISPDICSKGTLQKCVQYVQFILGSSRNAVLNAGDKKPMPSPSSTWSTVDDAQGFNSASESGRLDGFGTFGSTGGSLGSPGGLFRNTSTSTSNNDPEFERLSFSEFNKVLWQLGLRCTDKPPQAHPILHIQKLFRLMDSSNGRIKMAKRHRSASIIPPFIGCSVKDSAYVSSAAGGKGIMQYMREIMSQGPISPSRNSSAIGTPLEDRSSEGFVPVRLLPDMTPPDAKTLADELSDVIHDSLKLSVEKKWEDSNEQTTGEDSFLSDKSRITGCTNHSREVGKGLFGDRKSSHCAACAKEPSTLRDPLVFG